ncbi:MAG: TIGR01212 family radical SAM protein, partial [Lachnospiraceae bacterium]|nr:TIGR01212 family radical SAM protein [Lachnospiraceae bacterium]
VYKAALDAGMTCPNRDGTLDTRGCIFCSGGGSGEFAAVQTGTVTEQIDRAIAFVKSHGKYTGEKYIAYFQSFTNTYAPVSKLRTLFTEALEHPQIVGLSIGTRPDCFSGDIYALLEDCCRKKPVWIELGLQTIHEKSAAFIRRGYSLPVFEQCVKELRKRNLSVITHIILGLPDETERDILQTVQYLNTQNIQGIKFQLLHILKGTDLAALLPELSIYTQEEYINLLLMCIAHLSPDIVIHRLTGDGPRDLLLAPKWSLNKRNVLNSISHALKEQGIYQGKYFNQQERS